MPVRFLRRLTGTALRAAFRSPPELEGFPFSQAPHPFPSALLPGKSQVHVATPPPKASGAYITYSLYILKLFVKFMLTGPVSRTGGCLPGKGFHEKNGLPLHEREPVYACLRKPYACFICSISADSSCVCWASSATDCVAAASARAAWSDMLLTSSNERLTSSLVADCSSLAAAMAET